MKIAVVGATGLVGTKMLEILNERNFPVSELIPVASEKSVGKEIEYNGKKYTIHSMEEAIAKKPAIALFSAGGDTSKEWAPKFADVGTTVIDNSSAWRMDKTKKLIVPEINASELTKDDKIIAGKVISVDSAVVVFKEISAPKDQTINIYLSDIKEIKFDYSNSKFQTKTNSVHSEIKVIFSRN
jgi:aspartate-semialdehyde dehydrogenase